MTKLLLFLALPLYILDQVTKAQVVKHFAPPGQGMVPVPVIEGFFDIVRVHNTGIAFGRFNGEAWANYLFSAVALGALVFIIVLWKKNAFPTKLSQLAVALIVSGIFGNVTDRLYRGYVVDFLHFDLGFMIWPSFNVADACICVAATLLLITAFQEEPEDQSAPSDAEAKDS